MNPYQRMLQLYADGDLPWDDELPPPEVIAAVAALTPARALDLGCGYGRAARYLAERGWTVDAVDFVAVAIEEARRRAAHLAHAITFHLGSVTALDGFEPGYALAIDVGCGHALDADGLAAYHAQLRRLMAPGGLFLLYGRLRKADDAGDHTAGFDEDALLALFADGFTLDRVEHGINHGANKTPESAWDSAWFWFVRTV